MNHLHRSYESKVIARRCVTTCCSLQKKKPEWAASDRAGLVAHSRENTPSPPRGGETRKARPLNLTGGAGTHPSASPARHAGSQHGRRPPRVERARDEPDAGAPGHGRPPAAGACRRPPGEWRGPRHCAASEETGHEHGVLRGAATEACPASSPVAGGDDAEASGDQRPIWLDQEGEGTKGNSSTALIEE